MSSKELRRVGWSDALTRWEGRKSSFERIQDELETSENGKLLQELTDWKQEMNRMFAPDAAYLEDRLEDLFSAIQLPVDFSISYEIRKHGELLYLDVDLPEIEDYPAKKSQRLNKASGNIENEYLYSFKYNKDKFSTLI